VDYLYNTELPFSGIEISYKELNSKQQLNLAKLSVLYPITEDNSNLLEYSKLVKKIVLDSIENKKDFLKLNLIDYILFLTKLRMVSIGNELILSANIEDSNKKEDIKITIDLNVFMKSLYETCTNVLKDTSCIHNNVEIILDWPSLESEYYLLKASNTEIIDTIVHYIKTIKADNKIINLNTFTEIDKKNIFNNFPLSIKNIIEKKVFYMLNTLSKADLFGIKYMEGFNFSFYNTSYNRYIRYLFAGSLKNIYQEYYMLASKNINPLYVDGLSVSDRTVYFSIMEEEIKLRNESASEQDAGNSNMTDLQKLMGEFGEA
jgi:hypothetical protein